MNILREFYFVDWRYFVVCGNKFLQLEMTEISGGNYLLGFIVQVAEKWPAIIEDGCKKSGIANALTNGVPSADDPIRANLMYWIAVHALDIFCSLYIVLFAIQTTVCI